MCNSEKQYVCDKLCRWIDREVAGEMVLWQKPLTATPRQWRRMRQAFLTRICTRVVSVICVWVCDFWLANNSQHELLMLWQLLASMQQCHQMVFSSISTKVSQWLVLSAFSFSSQVPLSYDLIKSCRLSHVIHGAKVNVHWTSFRKREINMRIIFISVIAHHVYASAICKSLSLVRNALSCAWHF